MVSPAGLRTNIGLVDSLLAWGCVVLVLVSVTFSKTFFCGMAAWLTGLARREAFCVGVLMNCKGLVELVVLNIGLDKVCMLIA